jgi:alpha-L-rhamnosidase
LARTCDRAKSGGDHLIHPELKMKRRTLLGAGAASVTGALFEMQPVFARDVKVSKDRYHVADRLQTSLIWSAEQLVVPLLAGGRAEGIADQELAVGVRAFDLHTVFVKELMLEAPEKGAHLHIFAFTRYRLYINGGYVGRGPSRYQNERPEYDSWEVTGLRKGRNIIAVLAHRDAPTGRIMNHEAGMAAVLIYPDESGRQQTVASDESWRSKPDTSFGPRDVAWSSIEEHIDARHMPDWTAADFDAGLWPSSIWAKDSGKLHFQPRTIPLLRETTMPWARSPSLPHTLNAGDSVNFALGQIILGYHRLRFDADDGSEIEIAYILPDGKTIGKCTYTARKGVQTYDGGDTFAFERLTVTVKSGAINLTTAAAVEVRYPFELLGKFQSSDEYLNRLWALCARSLEVISEDAYVDCVDRERVEWIDETPPAFECTRVMMAGPKPGGGHLYADPRLLKALLQRIALTQKEDGQIKAHSCSERWDIHAIMEDRSCDWVIALRQYFDSTDDIVFVRSMWPTLSALMNWFLKQRTQRGLVQAREWEVWDNPLRYQVCEGAGLNAFVYRALIDAAYLGQCTGFRKDAVAFAMAANQLGQVFNKILWDEAEGAYFGGLFGEGAKLSTQLNSHVFNGPFLRGGYYRPTLQAALFALDANLVPDDRLAKVRTFVWKHQDEADAVMTHHFLFKVLYSMNQSEGDKRVLDLMRAKWAAMVQSPWGTSWEALKDGGGSKAHVYGMVPGYYLSAYVLGVRVEGARRDRLLRIEPRPGDLSHAKGVVVTEFGAVPIEWRRDDAGALTLNFTVPRDCTAMLRLQPMAKGRKLQINGRLGGELFADSKIGLRLKSGRYEIVQGG